jgi:hypothetical protein
VIFDSPPSDVELLYNLDNVTMYITSFSIA